MYADNSSSAFPCISLETASLKLKERTKYYWRVDVKDANENVYEGDVWSFVSTLPAPVATANPIQIVPTLSGTYGETTISWGALEGVTGYYVYLGTEKLDAARNFANKIWNVSKFVLMNIENMDYLY